jgi:exo-1,4-beta-D-glucosaminidase
VKHRHRSFCMFFMVAIFITVCAYRPQCAWSEENGSVIYLSAGWSIQSSEMAKSEGRAISSPSMDAAGWHPAVVPSTVLAALVKDGTYKDIFFGKNLETIPVDQFKNAWWYRNEFDMSREQADACADLIFEGINYKADVWLNGERIGEPGKILGAFRIFRLDVTGRLKPGKNVLALEIFPPKPGDFTMGFVDWNPPPPDRNMGLFRPVKLHLYKTVALDHLFVESQINHDTWKKADLTIDAQLTNHSDKVVETSVKAEIDGIAISENFSLQPRETRSIKLTPQRHPQLHLEQAHLWWPWELGEPNLYTLKMTASVGQDVADRQEIRFGIREVADYINPQGHRGYTINGKKILIRGGGWVDDLLLDEDAKKLEAQIQYTKAMNLNTIRMEGIWGSSQRIFDLCDQYGLLLMVGWSCQWEWQGYLGGKKGDKFGGIVSPEDMDLVTNYLRDQVFWLRRHPSIYVWVLGSDTLPRPELEKKYDALLAEIDQTRPTLKSCKSMKSAVSGPSAVKMDGPYDYVTPNYWYVDRKHGGAFGFNTETGPGPQPPPLESLKRMIPADKLWPINDIWSFHCGRYQFNKLDLYLRAYNNRYGEAKSVEEFAFKSQAANYEAIRAMYEAFAVNVPETTGIIQWMLNAAWPKMYWQLYDYYLCPGGAYFGTKKGSAPVSIVFNYGDSGIYLVNQADRQHADVQAVITVYDLNSKMILEKKLSTSCPTHGSKKILDLAELSPETPVFFLDLGLLDAAGKSIADNFYWVSVKPDVLDETKTDWFYTPNKSYADFTALERLSEATVRGEVAFTQTENGKDAEVVLTNTGDHLAFFIEMRLVDAKSRQTLLPVLWSDNYVSLPPGAKKTYRAHIPGVAGDVKPELHLQGWNVKFKIGN